MPSPRPSPVSSTHSPARMLGPRPLGIAPERPAGESTLVVAASQLLADALVDLLEDGGLQPVRLARSGEVALEAIRLQRPHLTVLHLDDAELGDPDTIAALLRAYPTGRLVGITARAPEALHEVAVIGGLAAVLSTHAPVSELLRNLRATGADRVSRPRVASPGPSPGRLHRLTAREAEVLDLLCSGTTTQMISRELDISLHTVRTHVHNILGKLGVSSRLQAVAVASRGADDESPAVPTDALGA